ncbi:MAG: SGNH/GDSL hydrolase family protein [Pseudomonadota bacterium]|nr:SGNH/GDSL hydrolase family protein [Pseudomonadota bacterium]
MMSKLDRWRRALVGGGALMSALLASCGGGSQVQTFMPDRVIAFGDETSVIDDFMGNGNGRKYTVNATVSATDPTLACQQNPLWIQAVASTHGLVFPQCNPQPNPAVAPTSRIRATAGAKAADIAAQIDAQLGQSAFTTKDLTTVLVGQNDILAQYAQYPSVSAATLLENVGAAGTALGDQVNRIANAGAKVLISTVPDLGVTPFAVTERAAHTDTDRAVLLSVLTKAFNDRMRSRIINDGRMIGLILTDEYIQSVVRIVNGGGFTNVIDGVCDLSKSALVPPSLLDCTNLTLVAGGNGTSYLWADATHLSSGGQAALGSLATARAANNPF